MSDLQQLPLCDPDEEIRLSSELKSSKAESVNNTKVIPSHSKILQNKLRPVSCKELKPGKQISIYSTNITIYLVFIFLAKLSCRCLFTVFISFTRIFHKLIITYNGN